MEKLIEVYSYLPNTVVANGDRKILDIEVRIKYESIYHDEAELVIGS